jgi:hypothetical protein
VGTLVRWLAVLLVAAGLPIGPTAPRALSREPKGEGGVAAEASQEADEWLRWLEEGIRLQRAALEKLQSRIPKLRERVEALTRDVEAIELPARGEEEEKSPPKGNGGKEVKFRPPKREYVDKPSIKFLCQEGKVSPLDFEAIGDYARNVQGEGQIPVDHDLPESDFRIEGHVLKRDGKLLDVKLTVIRKPGRLGESWEEIQRPGSAFQRAISSEKAKPKDYVVSFSVWPDSYETFRRARSLAWEAGFEVGWYPKEPGEQVTLGYGVAISEVD